MRQRWSPLSVSAAVSDLKLSIDLIPPRTGLHIKTDAVIQLLGDGYILCVCVCRHMAAVQVQGITGKKKIRSRVMCCPLIVIQTVISLRSPAQRLPTHIGLHF